ncbi:MAG: molybdopterin-binding protein [Candidatus Eremiobacter antarcticus]|nr:molybdopterin-dependent oxidoreductase [Candidatus Eremiobacteraeota bacterium]MBC5807605.1 molybdopterin-dependent oxidoreductase [Candidatus Eremiobacteraeota bacterium]PZR61344.1 MAG: molybdopterin-binding protein [Candidatus Eremiobacter sp. RRmetagenome_bin22]
MKRVTFISIAGSTLLTGCSGFVTSLNDNATVRKALEVPERLNTALLSHGHPLAREYAESAISPDFRQNGFDPPSSAEYGRWSATGWAGYRLVVSGLVDSPRSYDLAALRHKFPRRSQITRHDCVEGWSVIGKWTGVRLTDVLQDCIPKPQAGFVVFHCLDDDGTATRYYESLNMEQAAHPQALLAYELNDRPVPLKNGAPLRLKVPTQLGYKSAKYVNHIEVVARLGGHNGKGGYWEDRDYEWFAGI